MGPVERDVEMKFYINERQSEIDTAVNDVMCVCDRWNLPPPPRPGGNRNRTLDPRRPWTLDPEP